MFAARLARLLSILITSTAAVILPAPIVVPTAVAQESCFTGVDFAAMTYDELTAVVTAAVNSMAPGTPPAQIVAAVGSQIGANASGCSPEQLSALAQNVSAILQELGIAVDGDMTAMLVAAIMVPTAPATLGQTAQASISTVY